MIPNSPFASHLEQVSLVLYIPYITVLYHSPVAWWKSVIQTISLPWIWRVAETRNSTCGKQCSLDNLRDLLWLAVALARTSNLKPGQPWQACGVAPPTLADEVLSKYLWLLHCEDRRVSRCGLVHFLRHLVSEGRPLCLNSGRFSAECEHVHLHMLQGKLWRPTWAWKTCHECHEREDWAVETMACLFLDIETALSCFVWEWVPLDRCRASHPGDHGAALEEWEKLEKVWMQRSKEKIHFFRQLL